MFILRPAQTWQHCLLHAAQDILQGNVTDIQTQFCSFVQEIIFLSLEKVQMEIF